MPAMMFSKEETSYNKHPQLFAKKNTDTRHRVGMPSQVSEGLNVGNARKRWEVGGASKEAMEGAVRGPAGLGRPVGPLRCKAGREREHGRGSKGGQREMRTSAKRIRRRPRPGRHRQLEIGLGVARRHGGASVPSSPDSEAIRVAPACPVAAHGPTGRDGLSARSSESGCGGGGGGAVHLRSGHAKGCDDERGPARPSPDGGPSSPA